MSDYQSLLDPPVWAVRRRVLLGVLAPLAVAVGTVAVVGFARAPRPAYAVLDVRTTTTVASTVPQYAARVSGESWTVPALARAREAATSPAGTPGYYLRDRSGAWSYVVYTQTGTAGRWQRTAPPDGQVPALLTEQGVYALFARLRAGAVAGGVSTVALHNRMVDTFTARGLTWPYRYDGLVRVWMDDATGRPLQVRAITAHDANITTVLTTIDDMRTMSTTGLPPDFFTPPDEPPTLWDRLRLLVGDR